MKRIITAIVAVVLSITTISAQRSNISVEAQYVTDKMIVELGLNSNKRNNSHYKHNYAKPACDKHYYDKCHKHHHDKCYKHHHNKCHKHYDKCYKHHDKKCHKCYKHYHKKYRHHPHNHFGSRR